MAVEVYVVQGRLDLYHSGDSGKRGEGLPRRFEASSDYALLGPQVHGTYDKSGQWLEYSHTVEVELNPMSERKESSVLFSLRELQTIEEDRVSEEAADVVRAEEAATAAVEAEAQQIRNDEESRRVAAETSEREAREAVEQRQREEQMRLEESERRARVEAQSVVEQQRLGKEMELRIMEQKRKKPAWIIAVVVGAVMVVGLVLFFQNQAAEKERAKKEEAALQLRQKNYEKRVALAQADVKQAQDDVADAFIRLEGAVDEKSRDEAKAAGKRAREALKNKQARLESIRVAGVAKAKAKVKAKARKEKKLIDKCAKSNDPLCGL